ncbi:MAG TPA: hypothetical protein ENK31_06665 [Nannocystis exedens]|nr:hypothetical protein [Nannocystis exedens]
MDGRETSVSGDYSPVVGDFNGDQCDDILWFAPDQQWVVKNSSGVVSQNDGESILWQCISGPPGAARFMESRVVPPIGSYPVGYDPRTSVRRY